MGHNMGKMMGPLELAGGVGASLLGAPELGIPLAMGGLGSTVGQAAGGSRGQLIGSLAGGAAGLGAGGLMGLGPLSSLGSTGLGQSMQGSSLGQNILRLTGQGGIADAAAMRGAESQMPNVTQGLAQNFVNQAGGPIAPGAGQAAFNQAAAANSADMANAFLNRQPDVLATPAAAGTTTTPPATTPPTVGSQLKDLATNPLVSGIAGPVISSALSGGGQQQTPRPPAMNRPQVAQAPAMNFTPAVSQVPQMMSPLNQSPSQMMAGQLTPQQLQLARLLQGQR